MTNHRSRRHGIGQVRPMLAVMLLGALLLAACGGAAPSGSATTAPETAATAAGQAAEATTAPATAAATEAPAATEAATEAPAATEAATEAPAATEAATEAPAATEAATAAGAAAGGAGTVNVEFWNWWGVAREPLINQIAKDVLQKENPNITIKNVVQPWDRRDEVVLTAIASGDPPEVIMATRQEIVRFASEGTIVPITQYVKESGVDLSKFYESELETMYWEGELYSMPMPTAGGETGMVLYNKDLFAAAGLDPEKAPATWDELEAASKALTKRGENGAIEVLGADIGTSGASFLSWLYTNGGTLYSEDLKKVTFNSPEGVATLQWMVDFVNEQYGGIENYNDYTASISGEAGEHPFYQGRMGMQFPNVSIFFHLKNLAPDLKYGVGLRPYNNSNPQAKSQGVAGLSFGWGYVIPKGLTPEVEQAAYKWVETLTYKPEGACAFLLEQGRPSPIKECNDNPAYTEANPAWSQVQEVMATDVALPIVPPQSRILALVEENVELAFFGEVTPQEALDAAAEEAQRILDEYWSGR